MAGRIREEDIAEVREKARIDEVVSQYVTLRSAGGGSYKGLCPFHDEKSPSFNVNPSRGFYHCFGCQEGGDVISFLMKIDGLPFSDTVERLAEKYGVQLRYEEGGPARPSGGPQRPRMIEAHKVAAAYYVDQLATPEALAARQFLDQRGFDQEAAATFGVGFSPRGGEDLYKHLKARSFGDEELVASGLIGQGRGLYDRFRGRLMWPIRDTSGDTIGFGARRIFDDDRIEAKYLNTPETPIYKKSQVLYGIDLARRDIARTSQCVVVEGYTDVMACHLSGVMTAVATCGTAFGGDQQFVSQTYVAIEPDGLDPCDVRLQKGDAAVRELVARRVPLYRFVLGNVVHRYDLDRADGRIDALREAAKLVVSIRDRSKVDAFARELAGMLGIEVDDARREVRRAAAKASTPGKAPAGHHGLQAAPPPPPRQGLPMPDPRDPRLTIERETLKLIVQHPRLTGSATKDVGGDDFTHPAYRAVWETVARAGGPSVAGAQWASDLRASADDPTVQSLLSAVAVEGLLTGKEPDETYAATHVYRLQELTALRRIADLKSKLQRTNPVENATEYNRMFGELVALEQHRRTLRELAVGGS